MEHTNKILGQNAKISTVNHVLSAVTTVVQGAKEGRV
jgi:hypothetical protein